MLSFVILSRSRSSQAIAVCVADMSIFAGAEPKCEEGQIFSFQPNRWGNQQLPILVTSYFCDFNAPIVQNESGVACVDITPKIATPQNSSLNPFLREFLVHLLKIHALPPRIAA